jgi:hypothetical protein
MIEHIDLILKLAPLLAVVIATYFGLKIRPIEKDIAKNAEAIERVQTRLDIHLRDTIEDYHNFDRWRGEVTACLADNKEDHSEIKLSLKDLQAEIRRKI